MPKAQRTSQMTSRKDCSEAEDQEVCSKILYSRYERDYKPMKFQQYGCLNKT